MPASRPELHLDPEGIDNFNDLEREGFRLQLKIRSLILLIVVSTYFITVNLERALTVAAYGSALILLGLAIDVVVNRLTPQRWRLLAALLILFDVTTLSVITAVPYLVVEHPWPPQMALRFSSFNYLILYVMGAALTTSPVLVIWTGLAAAATWSACVFIVISLHGTITVGSLRLVDARLTTTEQLRIYLDPLFVSIVAYQAQLLVLLLGSSVLAFGVWRSRRSLFERIQIAAERRNLARFLPADLADDLASGPALEAVSRKPVAVLFVDIVGYTAISERMVPEAALTLLSAFRARVAAVVVEHGGTIDKFIGDGVMVTFGTRNDGADIYAEQSLRCTLEIVDDMERWNKGREAANEAPLRVGMGLQCGEMLVGTIGAIERLEHTVLGDAVNVASRLERLTREYGTLALVGEAVFERALRDCGNLDLLERFGPCIRLEIRGRLEAIEGRAMLANQ